MEELVKDSYKLSGDNYRYWSMKTQGLLEARGCWEAVDPGYGSEMTEEQRKIDHRARSVFYLTINNEGLDDIAECATAREIWETLRRIHTKYDTWHGLLLVEDFVSMTKKSDEKIGEYLTRRGSLYHKVKNAGFQFEEKILAGFAVLGLPAEYEPLARNLRADKDELTLASMKAKLIEEERRLEMCRHYTRAEEVGGHEDHKALRTQRRPKTVDHGNGQNRHPRRDGDLKPTSNARPHEGDRSHANLRCYSCLEFGHISRNCPEVAARKGKKNKRPEANAVQTAEFAGYVEMSRDETVLDVQKGENSLADPRHCTLLSREALGDVVNEHHNTWILDSGATNHMTAYKEKFDTYMAFAAEVEVAGGGTLSRLLFMSSRRIK